MYIKKYGNSLNNQCLQKPQQDETISITIKTIYKRFLNMIGYHQPTQLVGQHRHHAVTQTVWTSYLCYWTVAKLIVEVAFYENVKPMASLCLKCCHICLIGNRTLCHPFLSIIILTINKLDSYFTVPNFVYHTYNYKPNWTSLSSVTIIHTKSG